MQEDLFNRDLEDDSPPPYGDVNPLAACEIGKLDREVNRNDRDHKPSMERCGITFELDPALGIACDTGVMIRELAITNDARWLVDDALGIYGRALYHSSTFGFVVMENLEKMMREESD